MEYRKLRYALIRFRRNLRKTVVTRGIPARINGYGSNKIR